jgi:hypothetical protein
VNAGKNISTRDTAPLIYEPFPGLQIVLEGTCGTCLSFNRHNYYCAKHRSRVALWQYGCVSFYRPRVKFVHISR